ncbi:pyrroline-5-carboxylate reductase [Chthonobacter rhizosphaerae]|uniref:pyrroline-5-carboxylate reductase n=1 Tax=Chthonobacter rhizosphaerae TaxID=2735553 RepID=UPI0015EEB50A|nr:pyrroline-5-carboxylate reductase [Chthonobacter rhizosphaerae]
MPLRSLKPLVLVGAGKMGGAMLAGWLANNLAGGETVIVDPNLHPEMADLVARHGVRHAASPADVDIVPAVLVLAVKPQSMAAVLPAVKPLVGPRTVVMSVAAGTTLRTLAAGLGDGPIVRVMPNTPAQVGQGMAVAVGNGAVTAADRTVVTALMDSVGRTAWVDDEGLMDAVTAVSGSGPAYVFLLAEHLAKAGEAAGLPPDVAALAARQTVAGAGALLAASPLDPATLRQNVTSPGGTTAAALEVLMGENGLLPLLTRAVEAAARRGRELG